MALDLAKTVEQIDALARRLTDGADDREQRLGRALTAMAEADGPEVRRKLDSNKGRPYMCAVPVDRLSGSYSAPQLPQDFCVASVDGSHIDVDRHIPVRCYLINIGGCLLTYGSQTRCAPLQHPSSLWRGRGALHHQRDRRFKGIGGGPRAPGWPEAGC